MMDEPVRAGGSAAANAKPWHEELFGVDRRTIDCTQPLGTQCEGPLSWRWCGV